MYLPRRKCRKVFAWICLAVAAQVIFSLFLHVEFNFAPIRRDSATKMVADRIIKSRLRLQSQDVEQMDENLKFIGRAKVDNALGKGDGVNYVRNLVMKSTAFPVTRKNLRNSLEVTKRINQPISLSTTIIIAQDGAERKSVYHGLARAKQNNIGHEIRTENGEGAESTELEDIFISVKTTGEYHSSRLATLQHTWFQNARDQVYFFTDQNDAEMNQSLGGHLINTPCEAGHQRTRLCCKMQAELDFFVQNLKTKWFCHFDDDNYVNIPALVKTLQRFNFEEDVYLGKPSLIKEMEAWDRLDGNKRKTFWFATGGAGFCLSRALVAKMSPHVSNGKFEESCERIKLPDDCTVGFISETLLEVKLRRSELFHSHLEGLPFINRDEFSEQISFSHGFLGGRYNRVNIDGPYDEQDDPSRFKSIHCFLFPETSWCPTAEKANKIQGN